jgi:hypothetical protein
LVFIMSKRVCNLILAHTWSMHSVLPLKLGVTSTLNAGRVAPQDLLVWPAPPTTYTSIRRQSRSRSNMDDSNHLATSRSNLAHVVILLTYRASTTRVHSTCSGAAGYGRRSIRSAKSHALRKLPRLQKTVSFRSSHVSGHYNLYVNLYK